MLTMFTMSTAANPLRNDRTRRTNHRYETRISTTKARVRGRMKRARRKCSLCSQDTPQHHPVFVTWRHCRVDEKVG